MANHDLPRRGSSAHIALRALNNIGGRASVLSWMRVLNWRGRVESFTVNTVERLERARLIDTVGTESAITQSGRAYLGLPDKAADSNQETRSPVGPCYVPPQRPLDIKRHRKPLPMREGAFDFRNIPSRMAGENVPYKGSSSTA